MRDLRHRGMGQGPRRAVTAVGAVLLAAALSWGSPAVAEDNRGKPLAVRGPVAPLLPAGPTSIAPNGDGFYRGHLLPRLARQFEELGPYEALSAQPDGPAGRVVFDAASSAARRQAGRGTRRALKAFLLEATRLGRLVGEPERGQAGNEPAGIRSSRFRVGVRHGIPELLTRIPLGQGLLRTGLSLEGRVMAEYRGGRTAAVALRADYHPASRELGLAYRLSF